MLGFVTNLSMSLSSIHIEFTIEFLGFLVYVFGLKSGSALPLGDLGSCLKPPKGRRPHNKIYIKKKVVKNEKMPILLLLLLLLFAMRRRRGKKKRPNYNTQTILSKKKSKNKSALFLHQKYQQSRLINTIFQKRKVIYLSTDPTTPT
jgi:hypothetical protein